MSITEAGLRALAAARKVEKETLPRDVVEGTVLSRELARVISHFPGSPRLGSRQRRAPAADPAIRGVDAEGTQDAVTQGAEAVTGPDVQQTDSPGPEPGDPRVPETKVPESGEPNVLDESGSPAGPMSGQPDGASGEAAAEKARHLNGNGEN